MDQPYKPLTDSNKFPLFGLGTYKIVEEEDVDKAIDAALNAGYRLFDTAKFYHNEPQLGKSFKKLLPKYGLSRADIFIITKIWPSDDNNYELALKGIDESLVNLQTDYIDLILIHYPKSNGKADEDGESNKKARKDMWKAFEESKKQGKVRYIGVSNFEPRHIEELKEVSDEKPFLNQVEFHPHFTRPHIREYCEKNDIILQGYSSLARQNEDLINEMVLVELSKKYNVSVSIVLLSWILSQGFSVIAKSATPSRIAENFESTKLKLTDQDIELIHTLNKNKGYIRGTPWNVQ